MKTENSREFKRVLKITKEVTGFNWSILQSNFKQDKLVDVRKVLWTYLHQELLWTNSEIGKVFGRDQSSISRGIGSFIYQLPTSDQLKLMVALSENKKK